MPYTEDNLIEQPAINQFSDIDSQTLDYYSEVFEEEGIFGRENCSGVTLICELRAAIAKTNHAINEVEDSVNIKKSTGLILITTRL